MLSQDTHSTRIRSIAVPRVCLHLLGVSAFKDEAVLETTKLVERFASRHLLTWLEAISIIERVGSESSDTAYSSLAMVRTLGRKGGLRDIWTFFKQHFGETWGPLFAVPGGGSPGIACIP